MRRRFTVKDYRRCFEPQTARAHEGPPNLLLIRAKVPGGGAGERRGEVVEEPGA